MGALATGGVILLIIAVLLMLLLVFGIGLFITSRWIRVARADEALVISGRKQMDGDTQSSVTVIVNGRAMVNPITQRA